MARTPKRKEKLTKAECASAAVVLRMSLAVIEEANESLADGEILAVEYKQSLERGLRSIQTFANSLRLAVEMHRAGSPGLDELELIEEIEKVARKGAARKRASKNTSSKKRSGGQ